MRKIVVVINGCGGAGKDTLCEIISKHYKTVNVSAITPIKQIAALNGWDGTKDEKSRKFLSELKRVFIDYNDLPNGYLISEYEKFKKSDNTIMFVHIRENDQIDLFKNSIDEKCVTLLIRRSFDSIDEVRFGNYSDDCVEDYCYDYYYNNSKSLNEVEKDFLDFFYTILCKE